jgi:HK97 gp10 family phage protein
MDMKMEGFRDLEKTLMNLPQGKAKGAARRILKLAGEPIARAGAANAPELSGDLAQSYGVGTRLTKRQKALAPRPGPTEVQVFVGPNDPAALQTEFGNDHQAAQPHLRPAWDAHKAGAVRIIGKGFFDEVMKTVARHAKSVAKKGSK